MHFSKLLHTSTGRYMLSIILGLGLATLFRATCKGKNCVVYNAPPLEEIEGKTFKFDGKCYKYEPTAVSCQTDKEAITFK